MPCLFCNLGGPCTTVEHIIPQSLGNNDLILEGHVCDQCQNYFGKEIEQFVLTKTPIGAWRVLLGTMTKKGKHPTADLSLPRKQKGILPSVHPANDDVLFHAMDDGSIAVSINDDELVRLVAEGKREHFQFVLTPLVLSMLGRFLCKIGIELCCLADPVEARNSRFDQARKFARFGHPKMLWPILSYQSGNYSDLKRWTRDGQGYLVESDCYSYWLGDIGPHRCLEFGIGTDRFIIALDEPFGRLFLDAQRSNPESSLLWYSL